MFGATNKCFSIDSLIGTDRCAGSGNDLIRPTALRFTGSSSPPAGLFGSMGRSRSVVALQDPRMPPQRQEGSRLNPNLGPVRRFFGRQSCETWGFLHPWLLPGLQFRDNGPLLENLVLHSSSFSRKPKRIRTAFSPSQLLHLEQAFEKNHYVVGSARRQLATGLSLTETQVKVWFQNRRTKHKRQKLEEEPPAQKKPGAQHAGRWTADVCQREEDEVEVLD